jgi:hypothetical protein
VGGPGDPQALYDVDVGNVGDDIIVCVAIAGTIACKC